MTYPEAIHFLYNALPVFHKTGANAYKPGLQRIEALAEMLGQPQRKFASVHVAGTNGKGSVSHMIAAVLQTAGYRVGLFTSPHLRDFRERIRIDGYMITEQDVVDFLERHQDKLREIEPSFFEVTTALAFDRFAAANVDIAVIETGLGGRLDSTNIIRPLVSTITNISLDHTQYLGDTLEEIASEKAGIIKPETPVVIGETQFETQLLFIQAAKDAPAPIYFADQHYRVVDQQQTEDKQEFRIENLLDGNIFSLELDLLGDYQRKNIVTALMTLDILNGSDSFDLSMQTVQDGFSHTAEITGLRGRWQILSTEPLTVCDTGHNEDGIRELVEQIERQQYQHLYMVLGFAGDKNLDKVLRLLPKNAHYIFTRADLDRSMDPERLRDAAAKVGIHGIVVPKVEEAVKRAKMAAGSADMIFIGGSTFVVGEATSAWIHENS